MVSLLVVVFSIYVVNDYHAWNGCLSASARHSELLTAADAEWPDLLASDSDEPEDWRLLARRGGFPTPAIEMRDLDDHNIWFDGYVRTYLNRTKRLIKSPKLYWGDTGVALHLAGGPEPGGAHLENLVLHDLLAWRDARLERAELGYWCTATGEEVDFVIEAADRLLPVEVKATTQPRLGDAAHLRSFRAEYGKQARAGLLLHTGNSIEWLAPDVLAAPWWRVL